MRQPEAYPDRMLVRAIAARWGHVGGRRPASRLGDGPLTTRADLQVDKWRPILAGASLCGSRELLLAKSWISGVRPIRAERTARVAKFFTAPCRDSLVAEV